MNRAELGVFLDLMGQSFGGIWSLGSIISRMMEIREFENLKEQIANAKQVKTIKRTLPTGEEIEENFIVLEDGRMLPISQAELIKRADPRFLDRSQLYNLMAQVKTEKEWDEEFKAQQQRQQKMQILQEMLSEFIGEVDDPLSLMLGIQMFNIASQLANPGIFGAFLLGRRRKLLKQFLQQQQQQQQEQQQQKKKRR
jgi:hypothetical protein